MGARCPAHKLRGIGTPESVLPLPLCCRAAPLSSAVRSAGRRCSRHQSLTTEERLQLAPLATGITGTASASS